MAIAAATNQVPGAALTGYLLAWWIDFQWTMYADGDALVCQEVIIYANDGTTVIWRSGKRYMDGAESADGWLRVYPEIAGLRSGVAYKWEVYTEDDAPSNATSAQTAFTMETAGLVQADWRESA